MAWNRNSGPVKPVKKEVPPSMLKGIVAGLAVVAVCVAAFLIFSGGDDKPKAKVEKKPAAIKEVTPAPAPKAREPKVSNAEMLRKRWSNIEIPDGWEKPYPPQAYWPDGRLKEHSRYVKVVTNKVQRVKGLYESCFSNRAEIDIASALAMTPGSLVVGEYEYGPYFVNQFLESLKTEIVIDKEKDTPAMQELKRMVIETKKELKAKHDAGEDIAEIMNDTRKQLKELSLYRQDIEKMVHEVKSQHDGELTEQDEKDLVAAANKMLEERGCEPLHLPGAFIEMVSGFEEQPGANAENE